MKVGIGVLNRMEFDVYRWMGKDITEMQRVDLYTVDASHAWHDVCGMDN